MMLRVLLVAEGIAAASWAVLVVVAGNVGSQRLVSGGFDALPARAAEQWPSLAATVVTAMVAAHLLARLTGVGPRWREVALLVAVLQVVGAVAATEIVGELRLVDVPLVVLVLSAFGLQVLAAAIGVRLAARQPSSG